jgi:hypothetical protein
MKHRIHKRVHGSGAYKFKLKCAKCGNNSILVHVIANVFAYTHYVLVLNPVYVHKGSKTTSGGGLSLGIRVGSSIFMHALS